MTWIVYIAAGAAAGLLAGMGMGGGTLLIPALTLLAGTEQHAAQGINMLAFLPASAVAIAVHIRAGRLNWKRCVPLLIGGAAGAVCGALAAVWMDGAWLRRIFGGFLMLFSCLQLFFGEKKHSGRSGEKRRQRLNGRNR